jgi:arabinan endo-1,5-alpha-L-arabinosidase
MIGKRVNLIKNDLAWEGDVTEAPWVIFNNGYYYLFYSGFSYCDHTYAVGVARSKNALGPYIKKGNPILKTTHTWIGPGHCSVINKKDDPSKWVMTYHTWLPKAVCNDYHRVMNVDDVHFDADHWPFVNVVTATNFSDFLI